MTDENTPADNQPVEVPANAPEAPSTPAQPVAPAQPAAPARTATFRQDLAEKTLANPEIAEGYAKLLIEKGYVPDPARVTALEISEARSRAIAMGLTPEQAAAIPGSNATDILAVATYTAQQLKAAQAAIPPQVNEPAPEQPQPAPTPAAYNPPPAAAPANNLQLAGKPRNEQHSDLAAYFASEVHGKG